MLFLSTVGMFGRTLSTVVFCRQVYVRKEFRVVILVEYE